MVDIHHSHRQVVLAMRVMLVIGHLTRHACLSGQNASCAHFSLISPTSLGVFFLMKTCDCCLVSFPNFAIVLFNW